MQRVMMKSKIHRATVTEACLHYVGSITIDEDLLDAVDLVENEKVLVVDIDNGQRLETYVLRGERGSGVICLNGAAARLVQVGDQVIIMAFANYSEDELENYLPKVLFVNEDNKVAMDLAAV